MVSVVKNIILETLSMSVRYAESTYSPGGLQILSDNLAVVLALCKRRLKKNHTAFRYASDLCVWFPGEDLSYLSGGYRRS